ncbi:Cytochrome c, mono- and diheme variants [Luteitalea pratensis]|uniref:Cytochrome c, mono-and diheme variants n=1 Tax=Luteitalea pratensis TaxID=1855912 RepID=A0A143PGY1_LUTPR|nr:c-type cytochrome [Luteitalea pratensis]AMY07019.1 Cytochrome c, mono- and diheme variants [Luteitalea pratensis]
MRHRALGVLRRVVLSFLVLIALGIGAVYARTAWILGRTHDVALPAVALNTTVTDATEARRFTILIGCLSCHGRTGGGGRVSMPGVFELGAPNLTKVLPTYSDAELVRLLRAGVRRDGRTALGMPAATFYPMSDDDLGRVIGYLRSLPPAADRGPGPVRHLSFRARIGLVIGRFRTSMAAIDPSAPRWGEQPRSTPFERGRYLASITCSECHGRTFGGDADAGSPSLAIARGYDLPQFAHLLRTGQPIGGRDLGEMSEAAREDFVNFRDDEIADIFAFLRREFGAP